MTNQFRPIPGFEHYHINPEGVVIRPARSFVDAAGITKRLPTKPIKTRTDKLTGYIVVKLTRSNKKYGSQYVHRLVALTFLPNPDNKPHVNHLDGNKLNCSLSNLQWVTRSENHRHAIQFGLARIPSKNFTPVINRCTGETYPSIKEAAIKTDVPYLQLKQRLKLNDQFGCLKRAA